MIKIKSDKADKVYKKLFKEKLEVSEKEVSDNDEKKWKSEVLEIEKIRDDKVKKLEIELEEEFNDKKDKLEKEYMFKCCWMDEP